MHPKRIMQALPLFGRLWQCRQLTDKEGIDLSKHALGDGLIVEIMPGFKLIQCYVEAGNTVCG
jgi:hypothetical protein